MKHGNVIIRHGLALLLCNMAFFCTVRAATQTFTSSSGATITISWQYYSYKEARGTFSVSQKSGEAIDIGVNHGAGGSYKPWTNNYSYTSGSFTVGLPGIVSALLVGGGGSIAIPALPEPPPGKVGVVLDATILNPGEVESAEAWVQVDEVRLGPVPKAGLAQTVFVGYFNQGSTLYISRGTSILGGGNKIDVTGEPNTIMTVEFDAAVASPGAESVTGRITEFKNGKWYASVSASNLNKRHTVALYQVGYKSATLQMVEPGVAEIWLEPYKVEEGYDLQLKDETTGLELDKKTVLYVPLLVNVIINLKITNPGSVVRSDAYVRINGQQHQPGGGSLVYALQLGQFEPGATIPVIYGEGIQGSNMIFTVPNLRGDTVSFDVAGVVIDPGGGGTGPGGGGGTDPGGGGGTDPGGGGGTDPGGGGGTGPGGGGTDPDGGTQPPTEEPPEPPEPPIGPPVEPPQPPVEPPTEPPINPGEGIVGAINNIQTTIVEDGKATRKLTADGFNKVVAEMHNGTVTNAEGLRQVVESVKNAEYAVRDEGYKTRVLNADGFNRVVAAINAGNSGIIDAIAGSGFDDGRVVGAVGEVRDEVKELNKKFRNKDGVAEEVGEVIEGTYRDFDNMKNKYGAEGQGKANALTGMFGVGDSTDMDDGFLSSYQPATSWKLGKFDVPNPFFPTSQYGRIFSTLFRMVREIIVWLIAFWFMREVWKLITKEVSEIMMIPGQSGTTAVVAAAGAGGFLPAVGSLAGAAVQVAVATMMCVFIITLPLLIVVFLETTGSIFENIQTMLRLVTSGPMGKIKAAVGGAGDGASTIGTAIWYANQILPLALGFAAPVYLKIIKVVSFPTRFLARLFIKIFQSM